MSPTPMGPAYCVHHRILVTWARSPTDWAWKACPECLMDCESRVEDRGWLYELLPDDLGEAARVLDQGERRASAHFRANDPDVQKMRHQREGARRGGREKEGKVKATKVSDAQLKSEVAALVARGEKITNARRRVGKQHGIPLTTMRRRTGAK